MTKIKETKATAREPYFVVLLGKFNKLKLSTTSIVLAEDWDQAFDLAAKETNQGGSVKFVPAFAMTEQEVVSILQAMDGLADKNEQGVQS
jgi:hypothetical protein